MIENLECTVTFASSGFTLDASFQPLTGITAVVGENGTGKTFSTIELTRYLLYGKKALRGPASGYKNLVAKGDFVIRGEKYHIERRPNGEEITDETGKVLAVNAKAVTEKVIELMGYELEVFDICNASVQGKVHLFSQMQPAERKRMLDRVVGLTSYETIEKACRAEATALRRESESLLRAVVVPQPPVMGFQGALSDDLEAQLLKARTAKSNFDALKASLRSVDKPVEPDLPWPSPADTAIIEKHQLEYQRNEWERERIRKILAKDAPLPGYTTEILDKAEARARKRKAIDAAGPKPIITSAQLQEQGEKWAVYEAHTKSELVTCPNCQHGFHPTGDTPPMGDYSRNDLKVQSRRLDNWKGITDDLPEGIDLTLTQIRLLRDQLVAYATHQDAQDDLAALPRIEDKSAQLATLRERQTAWDSYLQQKLYYDRVVASNAEIMAQLAAMGDVLPEEALDDLARRASDQRVFEQQWAAWDAQTIAYNELTQAIADKQTLAEEYKKGGEALADARASIKAFLAPALSRTASSLLYDMTHGKLSNVSIDDDMNILVGSQTLETLSGGGLTAANIALRIALGQVLVGETFPVFLGDEIDADVDLVRRDAIIEAMVGLKDHLKQIILVTHRDVGVADHIKSLSE